MNEQHTLLQVARMLQQLLCCQMLRLGVGAVLQSQEGEDLAADSDGHGEGAHGVDGGLGVEDVLHDD